VRYDGLAPASARASKAARGSSKKQDTKPELLLRRALWRVGRRGYRVDVSKLPGRPDLVFFRQKVVVFCDGDFWHGRDLEQRIARLERGHNAPYWVEKIRGNVARDRLRDEDLRRAGWRVVRAWESDIHNDLKSVVERVLKELDSPR
jgi:DNA mismatch endonuclease (patch repair protein)